MYTIQQVVFYLVIAVMTFLVGSEVWKIIQDKISEMKGGKEEWQEPKKNLYQKWKQEVRSK